MDDRRQRLRDARLYLVCDARSDAFLERALRGGVDIVQLRVKAPAGDAELVAAARRFARRCSAHDALMILNDRPDLVVEAGADGVHVGQDDASVEEARAALGPERLVGLSTHAPAQIEAAADSDVDYIGVGPVHATPTKLGRPVGLGLVGYAADHARQPFFAIGGIDASNAAAVRAVGGRRIAVVRALVDAEDPETAARALRALLAVQDEMEVRVGAP